MTTKDQDQDMLDTMCSTPKATLADLRRQSGVSQAQIAERMGITQPRVSHLEARYPNIRYEKLIAYLEAIGVDLRFIGPGGINIAAHDVGADPTRVVDALKRSSASGVQRLIQEASAAKELPLQGNEPQPGGDDTGRNIDQADPESDQRDGAERQQP